MTPAEEGAYIRLLAHAWNSRDCAIPDDDETLSILSRLGPNWEASSEILRACFRPAKNGRLVNDRLLDERKKQLKFQKAKSCAGKAGNEKRWHSDRTAMPLRVANHRSSSSLSSSSPIPKEEGTVQAPAPPRGSVRFLAQKWNRGPGIHLNGDKACEQIQAAIDVGVDPQGIDVAFSNDEAIKGRKIWEVLDPLRPTQKASVTIARRDANGPPKV